ncbi:NUDIX domain-containing protein [Leifsonia sp. WHRI 6310E]|uniref:NUDIX domain-containing protein n=1 Tax=Leifsonia sp. WHRI 6310E TaxID=3162562 RepID=UPI0032EE5C5E
MPLSPYIAEIRALIGTRTLLLPGVTAVVRDERGRYLLARHTQSGRWSLVGGGVEPGEEPRTALEREIREELGVAAVAGRVVDAYGGPALEVVYGNGDRVSYVTVAYLCTLQGEPRAAEPDEIAEVGWFTRAQVRALDPFPWVDRVLEDADRL